MRIPKSHPRARLAASSGRENLSQQAVLRRAIKLFTGDKLMQKHTIGFFLTLGCLLGSMASSAQAQLLVYEGFDYDQAESFPDPADNTLPNALNGGSGWEAGWTTSNFLDGDPAVTNPGQKIRDGLNYIDSQGNRLETTGRALDIRTWGPGVQVSSPAREFDTASLDPSLLTIGGSLGAYGTTIWISVLAEGRDEAGLQASSGFSFDDTNLQGASRSLVLGRPFKLAMDGTTGDEGSLQNETYGFFRKKDKIVRANPADVAELYVASGVDAGSDNGNAEKVFMVLKLDFLGMFDEIAEAEFSLAPGDYGTNVSAWINPDLDADLENDPQGAKAGLNFADEINFWEMSFDIISAAGNADTRYDEFRIGLTYADVAPIAVGVDGDFDFDLDVDGNDFLMWQRGESPGGAGAADLALWEGNFGTGGGAATAFAAVPEPSSIVLLGMTFAGFASCRRRL